MVQQVEHGRLQFLDEQMSLWIIKTMDIIYLKGVERCSTPFEY